LIRLNNDPDYDATTGLLQRQNIRVRLNPRSNGKLVDLMIADFGCTMDYVTAIKLAAWLRLIGGQAKRRSGDFTKTMTAIAMLEDAEEAARKGWK
jgi:hypothetical protein